MAAKLSGDIKITLDRETATELEAHLDELLMKERETGSPDLMKLVWGEKVQKALARRLRPHMFNDNYTIKDS